MGPKEFRIVLDSPVHYPGQILTGQLVVELQKPIKIKGLYIRYSGEGTIHWIDGWGSTMTSHENSETYLMEHQLIFGDEIDECELARGKHLFNFSCQLPPDLPCSYNKFFGSINYSVEVLRNCPVKKDYLARQAVKIASIFDLNICPLASMPIEKVISKTFWGHSKPLCMSVKVPVRGFVAGQVIPIKVILNNKSQVQVKSLVVTLIQEVMFHATDKSNLAKTVLSRNEFSVDKGIGHEDIQLSLGMPASLQSYLQFCNIIDLRYKLDIKAKVSGCHKSLKIPIEVIVGDIPLATNYGTPVPDQHLLLGVPLGQEFEPPCSRGSSCRLPPYRIDFPRLPSIYETMSPPSYEASERLGRLGKPGGEQTSR